MLFDIKKGSKINRTPRLAEYERWKNRLTTKEFQAIVDDLDSRVSEGEVHTSSWMPGHDWSNTVFQPIYDRACGQHRESAAKYFGLILWEVMMNRDEAWSFGRYEKDGIPIEGMTYFRVPGFDHLC